MSYSHAALDVITPITSVLQIELNDRVVASALVLVLIVGTAAGYMVGVNRQQTTTPVTTTVSATTTTTTETVYTKVSSTTLSIVGTPFERSGPISTYPESWNDACGLPVQGNATTNVSELPTGVNATLSQVYSNIVNSTSFKSVSVGLGWVTTSWSNQEDSGPSGSDVYVVAQFVLLNATGPDGYVQANYNVATGAVTVDYQKDLVSSCPAIISSSSGANLVAGSPAYYSVGVPVEITFFLVDDRVSNMSVTSATSCLGNFTILQGIGTSGPVIYNSAEHGGCSGAPINVQLKPGQSYNQTLYWNQTNDGGKQVPSGAYEVMYNIAGSPDNYSSPVGEVYIATPQLTVNSSILRQQFYYQGNLGNEFVSPAQPVEVVWVLSNNGQQTYDLETSGCSYAYTVLNLAGDVVFSSSAHSSCNGQLQDNPTPPMGGISHVSYWNQTSNSGATVNPGFYRILVNLHVWSAGQEFNLTADTDLEITASSNPLSGEQISVSSSSICAANCGTLSPYLQSSVYANGDLKSLQLYLNGSLVGTMNYNLTANQLAYQVSFDTPINNSTIPIVPGVTYDIVFVGTFADGSTSITWANPLNPASQ